MSAVPRDPAFWKRFSMAAHLDMEKQNRAPLRDVSNSQAWLDQQMQKRRRNRYCLLFSSLGFIGGLTFIILFFVWLHRHGFFAHGEEFSIP